MAKQHICDRLKDIDPKSGRMTKEKAEKKLAELHNRFLTIQQAFIAQRQRALIVMEGWDASGKGGLIRRLTAPFDPRVSKVWPIGAPTKAEQEIHYLYRFWDRLPGPGTLAVFDRSWYGRVLVERVENLVAPKVWKRAYGEINDFERMLADDGVRIVKLFLHISPEEQLRRFEERVTVPYKRWKLTLEDIRNRAKWSDYEQAIDGMLRHTSTKQAPWHVLPADNKHYARVAGLTLIADRMSEGLDLTPPELSMELRAEAARLGRGDPRTKSLD
jgi:PPK2 family polyphosphate:nucleotide phosphotransferase